MIRGKIDPEPTILVSLAESGVSGTALTEALIEVQNIKQDEVERVANEEQRTIAEQERIENEQARVTNEGERVNAESTRTNAETNRASAETARVNDPKHEGCFLPVLYVVLYDGYKFDNVLEGIGACIEPHMQPIEIIELDERPFFHFKTNRVNLAREFNERLK